MARHVVMACVRQLGVKIIEAENGRAALDILRAQPKDIDLVITDMHMPQLTGDELCLHIRQELGLKDLPIIVLSSTSDHETKLRLFQVGATDYLEKPFIKEELLARISIHLKRQQLDHNVRANLERLKELDKLKDEFLAVCSHDLRSPLNGILGFTGLLLEDKLLAAEQRDMLRQIDASGRYLLELINDILDLGRAQAQKESMDFKMLAPAAILRQCAGVFQPQADAKRIKLVFTATPEAEYTELMANHTALARSFTNLISNAIKFTPVGGSVELRVFRDNAARELCLACADSGIGIPPEMLGKLFSRYSKISRDGTAGERGTGLGLNITRELITAHGGRLDVESRPGPATGTTFTIRLPLFNGAVTGNEPTAPTTHPLPAGSLRVLVTEDSPINLKLFVLLLQRDGHVVHTAVNGREALAAWQSQPFDVIFMDIEMPEMNGIEAVTAIRDDERKRNLKPILIIAFTAHTNEAEHQKILQSGCNAVLTKPIHLEKLRATMRSFIAG